MNRVGRRVKNFSLFGRMLSHRKGSVAVYVALVTPILIGIGALTIDLGRLISLNTELQSAADAASLACARELDRRGGSRDRCAAAALNAVKNIETFAAEGLSPTDLVDSRFCDPLPAPPNIPCIRTLKELPDLDSEPILPKHETFDDDDAFYGQVFIRERQINNILIRLATFGGVEALSSTSANAVAGQNQVFCDVPPMFMCNPTEDPLNTNEEEAVNTAILRGRQIRSFLQASGQYTNGNFGLLCPLGSENNCGANAVKTSLASVGGTCLGVETVQTKTGVALQQVRAGINARMDFWQPQSVMPQGGAAWRTLDGFQPAVNVTSGRPPSPGDIAGNVICSPKEVKDCSPGSGNTCNAGEQNKYTAVKLPRDQCHLDDNCATALGNVDGNAKYGNSRITDPASWFDLGFSGPTWNYRNYYRINHGCDLVANPKSDIDACKPADWVAVTGAGLFTPAAWPPTRYETYRYEIERTPPTAIVTKNKVILACPDGDIDCPAGGLPAVQTSEDGTTSAPSGLGCYLGTQPAIPGYNYFANDKKLDLALLRDRRIFPIAIANCNAIVNNGGSTNGTFGFKPSEFIFLFLTEVMKEPGGGDASIYVEILGTLDEGSMDKIIRDVVQIYRR